MATFSAQNTTNSGMSEGVLSRSCIQSSGHITKSENPLSRSCIQASELVIPTEGVLSRSCLATLSYSFKNSSLSHPGGKPQSINDAASISFYGQIFPRNTFSLI